MANSRTLTEDAEGEGESKSEKALLRAGLTVRENTIGPVSTDPVQAARLSLKFEELDMPRVVIGSSEEHDRFSKGDLAMLNTFIKQSSGSALVNKLGRVYKSNINTLNITNPAGKLFVPYFTATPSTP